VSGVRLDIDRLQISLHGVSSHVVEEAVQLLKMELRRRLGTQRLSDLANFDAGELALDPIRSKTRLDPASLSGLLADRLVTALFNNNSKNEAVEP